MSTDNNTVANSVSSIGQVSAVSLEQEQALFRDRSENSMFNTRLEDLNMDVVRGGTDSKSVRFSKKRKNFPISLIPLIMPRHVGGRDIRKPLQVPRKDHILIAPRLFDVDSCVCVIHGYNHRGFDYSLATSMVNPSDFSCGYFALDRDLFVLKRLDQGSFDVHLNIGLSIYLNSPDFLGWLNIEYGNMPLTETMFREFRYPRRECLCAIGEMAATSHCPIHDLAAYHMRKVRWYAADRDEWWIDEDASDEESLATSE